MIKKLLGDSLMHYITLFDIQLSKRHIGLKVPTGEYGLFFVAFKRFFSMSVFHLLHLMC